MASENKLQEIIKTSLENIRTMIDANTVIGTPYTTPSGTNRRSGLQRKSRIPAAEFRRRRRNRSFYPASRFSGHCAGRLRGNGEYRLEESI